ncbi:MAG: hypothetical protein EKK63_11100 [Acinetobacter sp.]|uniref:hypothetical protein n=1 Tax=Acinetobacter sp. TaxID=472 RepID=UPI000FAB0C36|nr:hypothetical protein [Acinetobacter sp.]RUP38907.1 MAG: hypothetical protein EKK63_11100 [Acinetobacter sp.]
MRKRLVERIFRCVVVGPRLLKATNGKWEVTNSKGDKFVIPFGILTEKRDDTIVRAFIVGKWQVSIATSPFLK